MGSCLILCAVQTVIPHGGVDGGGKGVVDDLSRYLGGVLLTGRGEMDGEGEVFTIGVAVGEGGIQPKHGGKHSSGKPCPITAESKLPIASDGRAVHVLKHTTGVNAIDHVYSLLSAAVMNFGQFQ